jgi:hypothetical protein
LIFSVVWGSAHIRSTKHLFSTEVLLSIINQVVFLLVRLHFLHR